jgi:hypothetical protein
LDSTRTGIHAIKAAIMVALLARKAIARGAGQQALVMKLRLLPYMSKA